MIQTKPKDKSLSVLIHEADKLFSELVRREDSQNDFAPSGYINCPICNRNVHWKKADAAHVFDRDNLATRFDTLNVWGTCQDCNRFDPEHRERFKEAVKNIIGEHEFECLEERAHSVVKPTRGEMVELIQTYKLKLKQLES